MSLTSSILFDWGGSLFDREGKKESVMGLLQLLQQGVTAVQMVECSHVILWNSFWESDAIRERKCMAAVCVVCV